MNYLTDREINVVGVQRTGQHAITSWLIGHFPTVTYKNCMSQLGRKKGRPIGIQPQFWRFLKGKENYKLSNTIADPNSRPDAIILGTEFTIHDIGLNPDIPNHKKAICNQLGFDEFSKRIDNILVIRNPYNQYASILKWGKNRLLSNHKTFLKMWIKMAKECLNQTNELNNKTIIKYDDWFLDINERIAIEEKLNLCRDDSRINIVMRIGHGKSWGSSFDGMRQSKQAQNMKVLNRWEQVKENASFIELTCHKKLKELSKELGWECPI